MSTPTFQLASFSHRSNSLGRPTIRPTLYGTPHSVLGLINCSVVKALIELSTFPLYPNDPRNFNTSICFVFQKFSCWTFQPAPIDHSAVHFLFLATTKRLDASLRTLAESKYRFS